MSAETNNTTYIALWISGMGIVSTLISSLIVVLINGQTTLKSKGIDAQLKRDEQSHIYKLEYLKRKLNAGEKAIGKINILISTLAKIKVGYEEYLNYTQLSPENAALAKSDLNTYHQKYLELDTQSEDYFHAYFLLDKEGEEEEETIDKLMELRNNAQTDIDTLANELDEKLEIHNKQKPNSKKLPKHLEEQDKNIDEMILDYFPIHDRLVSLLEKHKRTIFLEMAKFIDIL